MEASVQKLHLQAVKRESTKHTTLHGRLKALLNRGNELLGDVTASNLVLKLQATLFVVLIHGTDIDDNVCKLTAATGLLLVNLTEVDSLGDSLFIVNLGLALVAFYLKLPPQTVDDDVQVELTHAGDDGLATLLISADCESGILLGQFSQADRQAVHILLGLWLHGDTDNGIGEIH